MPRHILSEKKNILKLPMHLHSFNEQTFNTLPTSSFVPEQIVCMCGLIWVHASGICLKQVFYSEKLTGQTRLYTIQNGILQTRSKIFFFWLCWGLMTRQPLWVILCRLPEKGRKSDRRDSRRDEREGQGRKRNRNESEETEEIKTSPPYPYPLQG